MKNILIAITLSSLLSGCAINGFYEGVSDDAPAYVEKISKKNFLGIPPFFAFEGSSIQLNNEWRATAAHNKILFLGKEVYYHPRCDFALYKEKSPNQSLKIGIIHEKETLFHTGYPLFWTYSAHKSKYLGEVENPQDKCIYSGTDGTLIGGMSGGGVIDSNNSIVGVNVGIMYKNVEFSVQDELAPTVFISFLSVKDFIKEITGQDYYPEYKNTANALTEEEIQTIRKEIKNNN